LSAFLANRRMLSAQRTEAQEVALGKTLTTKLGAEGLVMVKKPEIESSKPASTAKKAATRAKPGGKAKARKSAPLGCCTIDVEGRDQAFPNLTKAQCKRKAKDNAWNWKEGPCFAT